MSLCKLCANETQRFKELRERLERIDRTIISMDIDVDFTEAKDTVRRGKIKPSGDIIDCFLSVCHTFNTVVIYRIPSMALRYL